MSSNTSRNKNGKKDNRMSSELQAIMKRRLAKCEEVPVDEQMQDEIDDKGRNIASTNASADSGASSNANLNRRDNSSSLNPNQIYSYDDDGGRQEISTRGSSLSSTDKYLVERLPKVGDKYGVQEAHPSPRNNRKVK